MIGTVVMLAAIAFAYITIVFPIVFLLDSPARGAQQDESALAASRGVSDPYFSTDRCVERLVEQHKKHGQLIIASDYDETIWDYYQRGDTYPTVLRLLRQCSACGWPIIIYTCSEEGRYQAITEYLASEEITIFGVNRSPVNLGYGPTSKLYYNLFLEDKSGLSQTCDILAKVLDRTAS